MLTTTRLRLEPIRMGHAHFLFPLLSEPSLYEFLPETPPSSVEALQERYSFLEVARSPDGREHWLNWSIFLGQTNEAVGTFQATIRDDGPSDIAYIIGRPHWHCGIAIEAGRAVITHALATHRTPLIAANLDTRNFASARLVERLGFIRVGVIWDADHFKGRPSHEFRYELPRSKWDQ